MEAATYLRFVLALVFVLGLIGGLTWLVRRYGVGGRVATGRGGRLSVVEVAPVDGKRRLVLLRRDDVEHLVMLSPTHETLIESGIPDGGFARAVDRAVSRELTGDAAQ